MNTAQIVGPVRQAVYEAVEAAEDRLRAEGIPAASDAYNEALDLAARETVASYADADCPLESLRELYQLATDREVDPTWSAVDLVRRIRSGS